MNWDWAEDMISSPSASLRELARHVRSTSANWSDECTDLAPEMSGLAYMRSPFSRKDWLSCSANACTPRVASWLGLMGVNESFPSLFLLTLQTKDVHRFRTWSCASRIPGSTCHKSELYKRFGRRHSKRRVNVQSAFVLKLVHGSSLKISPERYLQNSGLRSVGSSHGVSEQRVRNILTVDTCDTYSRREVRTG